MHQIQQQHDAQAKRESKPAPDTELSSSEPLSVSEVFQHSMATPPPIQPGQVQALQRLAGNHAVVGLLAAQIQPKLQVGAANDSYEQEADRVANRVMAMRLPAVQRQLDEEEVQTRPLVQRADSDAGFEAGDDFESQLARGRAGGSPLPDTVRTEMEPKFGADFSGVRVHTGDQSAHLNQSIQAQAFTHGSDIFFGAGAYAPETSAGQRLIAHELTHTIQQGGSGSLAQRDVDREGHEFTVNSESFEEDEDDEESDEGGTTERHLKSGGSSFQEQTAKTTLTEGNVTTETETSQMSGEMAAVEYLTTVSEDTIEKTVQVLALTGAFGSAAAKKVLTQGALTVTLEGLAKGHAQALASGKVSEQRTRAAIEIDGRVIAVMESLKYLAQAGVEVSAGGELSGKLAVKYGKLGAELAGKLQAFAKATANVGASFAVERIGWLITKVEGIVGANAQIGVEAAANGSITVTFGEIPTVTLKVAGGAKGFAGAKAEGKAGARFSLRDFFTLGFGATREQNEESGEIEEEDEIELNHGIALWAEAQAMAGAEGNVGGTVSLKVKDVSMDVTAKVEGLAGAEATAEAKFGISLTGITASAKAEAFAGAKADFKMAGAIRYKGKVIFKISGKAGVSAGVGGKVGGEFEFGAGKLKLSGALAGALAIGGEVELGLEVDFVTLAEAIKDLITIKYTEYVNDKKARKRRAIKFAQSETNALEPVEGTADEIAEAIEGAVKEPLLFYAQKKMAHGRHWIKKEQLQKVIDDQLVLSPELEPMLGSPVADATLARLAKEAFGTPDGAITFKQGTVATFDVTEDMANQKKVQGAIMQPLLDYAQKKGRKGKSGIKPTRVESIINKHLPTRYVTTASEPYIQEAIVAAFASGDATAFTELEVKVAEKRVTVPKLALSQTRVEAAKKEAIAAAVLQPLKDYIAKKNKKGVVVKY